MQSLICGVCRQPGNEDCKSDQLHFLLALLNGGTMCSLPFNLALIDILPIFLCFNITASPQK